MISKKLVTGLFAAGLSIGMLAVSSTASAQYIGPTRVAPTTVNKVLKSPVDDQYVLLSGKITSQVSKDKYMFTDKTGSIVVEIDNEVFAGRQVGPDTQVEIYGKIDKDMFRDPEIDVKRLGIPNQTK